MNPHIENFLEMMAAERGAARQTLDAYSRDLADAGGYLAAQGQILEKASTEDLRRYLAALEERQAKSSTTARRLSYLQTTICLIRILRASQCGCFTVNYRFQHPS